MAKGMGKGGGACGPRTGMPIHTGGKSNKGTGSGKGKPSYKPTMD